MLQVLGILSTTGSASRSTADVNAAIAGSTAGQVGTYAFLKLANTSDNGTVVDYTAAGAALAWAGVYYQDRESMVL